MCSPTFVLVRLFKYPIVPSFSEISLPRTLTYVPFEHSTENEIFFSSKLFKEIEKDFQHNRISFYINIFSCILIKLFPCYFFCRKHRWSLIIITNKMLQYVCNFFFDKMGTFLFCITLPSTSNVFVISPKNKVAS